jgi:glycosyltransferase involved in cell wall biosynthesis
MARVSVIIPTFNREAFVVKAVGSVLKQIFKDYELIVVDDGSTDATRAALQPFAQRIKYVYQENSGVSAARNAGVRLAMGEWLAFLDSDDEWSDRYLAEQMQAADQNPDVSMQVADCLFLGLNGEQRTYFEMNGAAAEFKEANYLRPQNPFAFLIRHQPWPFVAATIRREAILKAGIFDASLKISEDMDLMARVALQGPVGLLNQQLGTVYRRRETIGSLTGFAKADPIWARESDERLYQKLAALHTLSRNDRRALNQVRSANQRAMGNLLWADGKWRESRNAYRTAVVIDPSIRSLGKYLSSFLRQTARHQTNVAGD